MAISAYSATPASNSSISGINLAEGCNASGINDAIRQLMADLAAPAFGTGAASFGGTLGVTGAATFASTLAVTGAVTLSSTLAVSGLSTHFSTNNRFGNYGLLVGSATIFSSMDTSGGQVGAARGFFPGAGSGLNWDSATYITGTAATSINALVNANGVSLLLNAAAWSATSDYRSKDVYGEFADAGAIVDAVPVHLAQYKNKTQPVRPMFLAHELAEGGAVFAVHGDKDAVDGEGKAVMQSTQSTDPLVPILWAAVRELRARIAVLEAAA